MEDGNTIAPPSGYSKCSCSGPSKPVSLTMPDGGKKTFTLGRGEVFAAMKRDLSKLRGYLAQANL